MKTIAFFNVKGGVGKTTSAINIAYNLTAFHKKKVLLIDVDPQSNCSYFFDADNNEYIIEDMLRGYKVNEQGNKEPVDAKKAIAHTQYKNLDIIPTRYTLWNFEKELTLEKGMQQYKLRDALQPIQNNYDYIVVDCTNIVGNLVNLNVFAMADYIFVPMRDEAWATKGLLLTKDVIADMNAFNKKLKLGGAFFTAWEKRKVTLNTYDYVKTFLKDELIDVKIRKHKSAAECSYARVPLSLYDKNGKVTEDYRELTKIILKRTQD